MQHSMMVSSYQLTKLLVLNNGSVSSAHRLPMLILDVTSLLGTISGQSESKPHDTADTEASTTHAQPSKE